MTEKLRNTIQCIILAMLGTLMIYLTISADSFKDSWGFAAIGSVCYVYAIGKMQNS